MHRVRALLSLISAIVYIALADFAAHHAALALLPPKIFWLGYEFLRLLLLLAGFIVMDRLLRGESRPLTAMGWTRGPATRHNALAGIGLGWALVLALVIPIALFGRLLLTFDLSAPAWSSFFIVALTLLLGAAARETAFRGYPFQRLIEATSPVFATILFALTFGLIEWHDIGGGWQSVLPTMLLQVILCMAYLRTGSLWMSWGIDFGWRFAMGALFGLPVSGVVRYSTVAQGDARGPVWLTGSFFGPAGSALAPWALLVGIFVLLRLTSRDIIAEIRPGGIPVDLEAMGHPEHPAPAAAPAAPSLIQILPSAPPLNPLPPKRVENPEQ